MTKFVAIRTAKGVPIWDLMADGVDIGLLTNFPGEGPMATVRYLDATDTCYNSVTIHEALVRAKQAYLSFVDGTHHALHMQDDDYIEDEDGSIAHMKMMERRAEGDGRYDEPDYC